VRALRERYLLPVAATIASAALLWPALARAQEQELSTPYGIHVPLLLRLLSKSRGMSDRLGPDVVIAVAGEQSLEQVRSIAEGKKLLGKPIRVVAVTAPSDLPDVIYIGPDSPESVGSLLERAASLGAVTITGIGGLVPEGVALGIKLSPSHHPKITVNLPAALAQGVDLPADVLGISEVVR